MVKKTVSEQFIIGRNKGVSLMAIETPDADHVIRRLAEEDGNVTPMLRWDVASGINAANEVAKPLAETFKVTNPAGKKIDPTVGKPEVCTMRVIGTEPPDEEGYVVFMVMAHKFLKDPVYVQAIRNARDELKEDGRTLVLIGECMKMPPELRGHVVVVPEELPDDDQLLAIVKSVYEDAKESGLERECDEDELREVAEMLRGCFAFGAETLAAMSVNSGGFDREVLRLHAERLISETPGLSVDQGGETFDDIGGLKQIKRMADLRVNGKRPPRVIVRVEEIEKTMGHTEGDLSTTSSDFLQVMLSEMEDNKWSGLLAFGCAGSGKSLFAKAMANTYGRLPMRLDINACKDKLVGSSEANIRAAMRVIKAIGGEDVLFVASMNRMEIPPELRRRFRAGVWFFDTPDGDEERPEIWDKQLDAYGLGDLRKAEVRLVDEDDMTGADIRNICELSSDLDIPLAEAKEFTVLQKHTAPESIEEVRRLADGRFNSASYPGRYEQGKRETGKKKGRKGRKMKVGEG